jgi:septal ring factor EnvC (AmiA/AmiB activator)
MKMKNWVLWLCVAALLATEGFLFVANRQKDAMRVQLNESQQKVEQLQADLDKLKNSSVFTLNADNARLRAENQGLTQKFSQQQNQTRQLQQQIQKMNQQLESAHNTAQQQQQQLEQMQTESQQATQPGGSAQETAAESSRSAVTQLNACINNLRQIDAAKQQWALENDKTALAVPTVQDLLPYFTDGVVPVCPGGGAYSLNAVGILPTCSVPSHVLPQLVVFFDFHSWLLPSFT